MARGKKRQRQTTTTAPPVDAEKAKTIYAAFVEASDAFFASDATARTACEEMELDRPMADLRGCLALMASGAKPSCLIAFGMQPDFAKRLVEGLWAPFCREHLPEITVREISGPCDPLSDCSLQNQFVAFPEASRAIVEKAFFSQLEGEALFEAIGASLGYPNEHGLAADCRVEYSMDSTAIGEVVEIFVLEYLAASDNFAAVTTHFASCADALARVGNLCISVDGVELDAAAVRAGGDNVLSAAGWAPGLNAFEADIDFS